MITIYQHQLLPLPPKSRYISPTDLLILEDELQRILLIGNIKSGDYVTGVVIALLGHEDDTGKFVVEDICPANIPCSSPSKSQFSGPK
jgi:DNA polymerase delta subunit 2